MNMDMIAKVLKINAILLFTILVILQVLSLKKVEIPVIFNVIIIFYLGLYVLFLISNRLRDKKN